MNLCWTYPSSTQKLNLQQRKDANPSHNDVHTSLLSRPVPVNNKQEQMSRKLPVLLLPLCEYENSVQMPTDPHTLGPNLWSLTLVMLLYSLPLLTYSWQATWFSVHWTRTPREESVLLHEVSQWEIEHPSHSEPEGMIQVRLEPARRHDPGEVRTWHPERRPSKMASMFSA